MNRFFATALCIVAAISTIIAGNPDFAYPQTTIEQASKNYNDAMTNPNSHGVELIKSILEIAGATSAINMDSLPSILPKIDNALSASTNPVTKSLLTAIKADIVNSIYSKNSWKYNRVMTPDSPLPADITEWNGNQFRNRISNLADSSFRIIAECIPEPLSKYSEIVTADKQTIHFFPTIQDFIASKAINLLTSAGNNKASKKILSDITELSKPKSASWFYWTIQRYEGLTLKNETYNEEVGEEISAIQQLYLDNRNCEEAGYALLRASDKYFNQKQAPQWLISNLRDFIKRYPTYILVDQLKNKLTELTNPQITVTSQTVVAPKQPFNLNVNCSFTSECKISIFKISRNAYNKRTPETISEVKTIKFNADANSNNVDTTISLTFDKPGYYRISPMLDVMQAVDNSAYIKCTPFIPAYIKFDESEAFITADYSTGKPIKDIAVSETTKDKTCEIGKTDINGILKFKPDDGPGNTFSRTEYEFTYQGETFDFFYSYRYGKYNDYETQACYANIYSDRQLYHPGDTVRWAALLYTKENNRNNHTYCNRNVRIDISNANGQLVDSILTFTDDFGRTNGSFLIPAEGLTGRYTLEAGLLDNNNVSERIGSKEVTVSDFKLPTFKIDSISVKRDLPKKGDVCISGTARTYAGMSVAGAAVLAEIYEGIQSLRYIPARQIGILDTKTDNDGNFMITVPDSITSMSDNGCFVINITITSTSGETQHTSKSFSTGKPYYINFNGATAIINTDNKLAVPFNVLNPDGKKVNISLKWWLNNHDDSKCRVEDAILSGICQSCATDSLDWASIPSGYYNLSVAPVDTALANTVINIETLELYSLNHNTLPENSIILVPCSRYITDNNGEREITFGISKDNTYVYIAESSDDKSSTISVTKYGKGFHSYKIKIPESANLSSITLFTVLGGKTTEKTLTIKRPDKNKLTLVGSSMRDRLQPGTPEEWHLSLSDADGKPTIGAMIATMFNSALNSLQKYNMPQQFFIYASKPTLSLQTTGISKIPVTVSGKINLLKTAYLQTPEFNPSMSYSNLAMLKNSAIRIRGTSATASTTAITGLDGAELKSAMVGASIKEESAIEEDAVFNEVEVLDSETGSNQNLYRPSEVLQALWMPELTADDNGEFKINFTVPNANTTWSFYSFAWTNDLRSASMIREFIASKPVMVQPNLPRFLRAGDRAEIIAEVFNNSDSSAIVSTVIELFDLTTGNITSTKTVSNTIDVGASAIVSITVNAPDDVSAIGYRVRSALGKFTDGEQAYIPIEPATSTVIESEAFYLNPDDAEFTMNLPKGKNMQSVLDYTANPAWNIIKELPGLNADNTSTSTAAVRRLFGAATASGMMHTYPALAKVLKEWCDNPDSKALTSRLSQNEELKAAILSETPWVQAAAADTHRMMRLGLLFDKKATDENIDKSIALLSKLQNSDGGWSWGAWSSSSSIWATNAILQELGKLKSIGYMPQDKSLIKMIEDGIKFYEANISPNVKTDYQFTYMVSMFPDCKLGIRGNEVVNATIQSIIGNWKSSSTATKAVSALILDANGYKAVAKEILGSIKQFAVTSSAGGTSFPSVKSVNEYADLLYAFAKIEPDAPEIDGMKQWLILRQQSTSQLGSFDPTRIIAAFTACGSKWLNANDSNMTIKAGDTIVPTNGSEIATGNIVTALPSSAAGKQLSITRTPTTTPAYGAVITQYTAKSNDIKAVNGNGLSIEKRISVLRDGSWQYVDEVRLGEQVRITLTIKTKNDMDYVTIIDERPAAFEPVDQLPGWVWSAGTGFYRENENTKTNLFINHLSKGTYQITIDMTASIAGKFTSGIATIQSQLSSEFTAHSAGSDIICME